MRTSDIRGRQVFCDGGRRAALRATLGTMTGAAACAKAFAQPRRPARIGYLVHADRAANLQALADFEDTLAKLGWSIGRDLVIEYQYGEGSPDRLAAAARALVPRARRVAVLRVPNEYSAPLWQELSESANRLDVTLLPVDAAGDGFPAALSAVASLRADALCLVGQGALLQRMRALCDFALAERLPATFALKRFARAGLLFTYGIAEGEGYRLAAVYADRILKGAQPAELPIEQLNRYELTINRRTAELLGVRISADLLLQADEVIG